MSVLFLAPSPPCPGMGGGSLRMFHMARFLGQRFPLDLVAPALEGMETSRRLLSQFCAEMEFVPPTSRAVWRRRVHLGPYERDPALRRAVQRRLETGRYAAVHVEKPAMLPVLPAGLRLPIVLDTFAYGLAGAIRALRHERGVLTRARNLLRLARFATFDAWCWPETHCILVVSEPDRKRCLEGRPRSRVLVVPNGVDCSTHQPGPFRENGPPLLVFTGDMAFDPNIEAAQTLATQIFPTIRREFPEAELRIVGRNPTAPVRALRGSGVTVTGEVEDVTPHLQAATLYVAPLTIGAGTRTKLLEALAVGVPIVTTRVGIEGIDATDGVEVVLADDPEATIASVRRLLVNPAARRRLSGAARRLAEREYDWRSCLAPLEDLYGSLLPPRPA